MKETVLTKQLGDGRTVEVQIQEYTLGHFRCLLYLAGCWVDGPAMPLPLPLPRGEITHYLGGRGGKPTILFTQTEAEYIFQQLSQRELETDKLRQAA